MSVSTPYIHTLAPRIVEYLYSDAAKKVTTENELMLTLEAITTVESLISLAEPQNRKYRKAFTKKKNRYNLILSLPRGSNARQVIYII